MQNPPQFRPPELTADSDAEKEALLLDAGADLESSGKKRDFRRDQLFKDHVNHAALAIFWMVVFGIVWGIVAYGWHLLMPESWHYLSKAQLDKVEAILAAAILSSALTGYANKRM